MLGDPTVAIGPEATRFAFDALLGRCTEELRRSDHDALTALGYRAAHRSRPGLLVKLVEHRDRFVDGRGRGGDVVALQMIMPEAWHDCVRLIEAFAPLH